MAKDRVAEERADEVRRRLKQTRTDLEWSFWRTVKEIKKKADVDLYATEVRRYEGSDPARRPVPTVDYVKAFAKASGKPERYMLAEDVLPYDLRGEVQQGLEDFRELRKKLLSKMPRPATSEEERKTDRRRDPHRMLQIEEVRTVTAGVQLGSRRSHDGNNHEVLQVGINCTYGFLPT